SVGAIARLAEDEEPCGASRKARGGGGLGPGPMATALKLKRVSNLGWSENDYDVLLHDPAYAEPIVVGRIWKAHAVPRGVPPWHRGLGTRARTRQHRTPIYGYEPTREAAMAAHFE